MPAERFFGRLALVLLAGGVLAACTSAPPKLLNHISAKQKQTAVTYCEGHGCRTKHKIALSNAEWRELEAMFDPAPASARAERARIAGAVAYLEAVAGERTGTWRDRGGTLEHLWEQGQLDCFDEAINTSNFIALLDGEGLLTHHRLVGPLLRNWSSAEELLHATAVIVERGSGRHYAVDSWFFDNGEPPFIVEASAWRDGARPERSEARLTQ